MAFNAEKFERAKFEPRKKRVPVAALSDFFAEGDVAEFEVRGLTSNELHKAINAGKNQSSIETILKAIADNADQAVAVRKALGLSKDTPGEIAKRLEMLVSGTVEPVITLPIAVMIAERFPIEFLTLTNEITELTGQGFDHVKPKPVSEKTKK